MRLVLVTLMAVLLAVAAACSSAGEATPADAAANGNTGEPESRDPAREPEEDEGGEESGVELALDETYDRVRNGAHLVLAYDAETNAFSGTVENTTTETLKKVRVEVHLSNGKELGPTSPGDLDPGEEREIVLAADSTDFERWTAHPEVGEGEHGGEERGEHDREGEGEHGREGRGEHSGERRGEHEKGGSK